MDQKAKVSIDDAGKVTFHLENDPIVYTLVYDFNELADAEAVAQTNLLQAVSSLQNMTAVQMRGLLYACLKTSHPLVLLKEAGDLLSKDSATVTRALGLVMGATEEEQPEEEVVQAAPVAATAIPAGAEAAQPN